MVADFSLCCSSNRDRGEPRGSSPPTPPHVRITYAELAHTPLRMEDFPVTCPLVPGLPHLLSGSCSSPRALGLGFLQTPPRGDALALLLAFGSASTWHGDSHPARSVPCLAHTLGVTCSREAVGRCTPLSCATSLQCQLDHIFDLLRPMHDHKSGVRPRVASGVALDDWH